MGSKVPEVLVFPGSSKNTDSYRTLSQECMLYSRLEQQREVHMNKLLVEGIKFLKPNPKESMKRKK